ncbi:hypothetical protein C0993_011647 [Termitomyces sp. T159_Od127]|nr:hypothetical protein C0993_011647 [Termitomyces sp. T159_Od127]
MQTDPSQSPPTNRCNRASHNIASPLGTPLASSFSEVISKDSTPFSSQKNGNGKRDYKKRQTLSSSLKAPISTRTVSRSTSSALTRSPRAVKRLQSRDMPSTDKSENSRLYGRSLTLMIPDQSSGLARFAEESQQRSKVVHKLPRFKKNSPAIRQTSDELSSSSSSAYPRSTPSDGSDLNQVLDSGMNENHSALAVLDVDLTIEQTPSISNNVHQTTQPTLTDNDALDKAVKDLVDAARNIVQLQHIPPQNPTANTWMFSSM